MESLISLLEREANTKVFFERKVFDVVPGQGAFHQQPNYVKKIIRKEHVLMKGKPKVIRRVYCKDDEFEAYQNVGWVLFTDVQHCMLCQKSLPRFIGRHLGFKKHCHVCGNLVCKDCHNPSAVRITEFKNSPYVDACGSCYWGQEEISLSLSVVTQSVKEVDPTVSPESHDDDCPPHKEDQVCVVESTTWEKVDYNRKESEEYDIENYLSDDTPAERKKVDRAGGSKIGSTLLQNDQGSNCDINRTLYGAGWSNNDDENPDPDVTSALRRDYNVDSHFNTSHDPRSDPDTTDTNSSNSNIDSEGEEEGSVSDVNRVNLMMLLSTLSIVHNDVKMEDEDSQGHLASNDVSDDIHKRTGDNKSDNTDHDVNAERSRQIEASDEVNISKWESYL